MTISETYINDTCWNNQNRIDSIRRLFIDPSISRSGYKKKSTNVIDFITDIFVPLGGISNISCEETTISTREVIDRVHRFTGRIVSLETKNIKICMEEKGCSTLLLEIPLKTFASIVKEGTAYDVDSDFEWNVYLTNSLGKRFYENEVKILQKVRSDIELEPEEIKEINDFVDELFS